MQRSLPSRLGLLALVVVAYGLLVLWWRVAWPIAPDFIAYHPAGDVVMPATLLALMAGGVAAYYALFPGVIAQWDRGGVVAMLLLGLGFVAARGLTAGLNDLLGERATDRLGTVTAHLPGAPRRGAPQDDLVVELDDGGRFYITVDRAGSAALRYPVGARVRASYHRGAWFDWGHVEVIGEGVAPR